MMRGSQRPLVERVLGGLLREIDLEAAIGDLTEEHARHLAQSSPRRASRWYVRQVVASVPPLLWACIKRGAWVVTFGVALGAFAIASLLELAADAALSRYFVLDEQAHTLLVLVVGLAAIALAGYLAARFRRGAASALALIVLSTVMALMLLAGDSAPLWYQLSFLVAGPWASLAGGALRTARRTCPRITEGGAR